MKTNINSTSSDAIGTVARRLDRRQYSGRCGFVPLPHLNLRWMVDANKQDVKRCESLGHTIDCEWMLAGVDGEDDCLWVIAGAWRMIAIGGQTNSATVVHLVLLRWVQVDDPSAAVYNSCTIRGCGPLTGDGT